MIVMTAIVSASPICRVWYRLVGCMCATTPEACRQTGTDAEAVSCRWLLSVTFWVLPSLPDVRQGGPGTMLPIWKQLLLGLDDLMDGEIFLGCPAEPADRDPINHPPPVPTDGHPPQVRLTGQGFCQGIFSSLHSSLCWECFLCIYLLPSHSDYHYIFAMIVLFVLLGGLLPWP